MRKSLLSGLLLAAAGALFVSRQKKFRNIPPNLRRTGRLSRDLVELLDDPTEVATRRYMMYVILPLWVVPGVLDYAWHRRTKIEDTAGVEESVLHLMMMAEGGVAVVSGLMLEINAGVIALMLASFLAHEATAIWDVNYAYKYREIPPGEQHVHGSLEMMPFCALSFAICLHWDQALALLGYGPSRPDFRLRPKQPPLPASYLTKLVAAASASGLLYVEELWRCWRARQKALRRTDPNRQVPPHGEEQDSIATEAANRIPSPALP
jgi:hypothetical protein